MKKKENNNTKNDEYNKAGSIIIRKIKLEDNIVSASIEPRKEFHKSFLIKIDIQEEKIISVSIPKSAIEYKLYVGLAFRTLIKTVKKQLEENKEILRYHTIDIISKETLEKILNNNSQYRDEMLGYAEYKTYHIVD